VQGLGLSIQWRRGDPWLFVVGPAQRMGAAFSVGVHDYLSPQGIAFYASQSEPTPPPALAGLVSGVGHLSNYLPTRRALPHGGLYSVPPGGLKPADALMAYDLKPLRDQGIDGRGETVVVWALGGDYAPADLDTFSQQFGLPPFQIERRGRAGQPDEEIEMDVEVVHALAPGARLVVYTDNPPSDSDFLALQERMVSENPGALFNNSWGGCDLLMGRQAATALASAYERARASGGTIFASTGESGAFDCLTCDWGAPPTTATLGCPSQPVCRTSPQWVVPASACARMAAGTTRRSGRTLPPRPVRVAD
jgi:subtilase family serine protease